MPCVLVIIQSSGFIVNGGSFRRVHKNYLRLSPYPAEKKMSSMCWLVLRKPVFSSVAPIRKV
jgi:hypothetical protein